MIITAILEIFIFILGLLLSVLDIIPGVNSINNAIQPYIDSLVQVINSGANLISFFVPIALLKVLIPLVLIIEIAIETLDIVKFGLRHTINR